ncbi:MAG: hypothetical protein OEL75_02300, partial [Kiritimatiellaceae bacterium]|nr:hypothetical protein [Kiritimatiellaceae bacterium]
VDNVVGTVAGALFGLLIGISALSLVTMVPHDSAYQTLSEESLVGAWVCGSVVPWLHPRMLELPMFDQE